MEKKIEIKNNMPRLLTVGASQGGKDKDGKAIPSHGKIVLLPGTNPIDEADWNAVKNLKVIRHYLASKGLEEGESTEDAGALSDLKPSEAIRKIGDCLDPARLRVWLDAESRVNVKRAIEEQVAKLEAAKKKPE